MHPEGPIKAQIQGLTPCKAADRYCSVGGGHAGQELYKLDPLQLTVKKVYEALLFICELDVFLIPKDKIQNPNSNKCNEPHVSEHRCSQPSKSDLRRARILRLLQCLVYYLVLRFSSRALIGFVQLTWIQLNRENFRHLDRSSPNNASDALAESCPLLGVSRILMPTIYEAALEHGLNSDDPYSSSYRFMSTDLITGSLLLVFDIVFIFLVMPLMNKAKPLDAAIQRFILDPAVEIQRLDSVIQRHLKKLLDECPRDAVVLEQLEQVPSLRFDTSSPEWRKSLIRLIMIDLSISFSGAILTVIALIYVYLSVNLKSFCGNSRIEVCTFGNLFTMQDYLYIFEALIIDLLVVLGSVMLFSFVVINGICQISLVLSVEKELRRCLSAISLSNLRDDATSRRSSSLYSQDLFGDTVSILKSENTQEQKYIESALLRAYIKLVVSLEEAKNHSRLIGRILELHITVISIPGLLGFSMRNLSNNAETQLIQLVLLFVTWVFVNPGLVLCAYIHSRTIERERIAWSILAQLSIYKERNSRKGDLESFSSERHTKMLTNRWRKLVKSFALSDPCSAIEAFGMKLTYSRVLSINYALVSVILLYKHSS